MEFKVPASKVFPNNKTNIIQYKKVQNKNDIFSTYDNKSRTQKSVSSYTKGTTTTSLFSDEEVKFGKNSLWIFSQNNKFRILTQSIVSHKAFSLSISIIIILNSIFLAFETVESLKRVSLYSNYLFTILFTLEFIIKVVAFGFVMDNHTYLRDPWNWLDFVVVVTGLISLLPGISANLQALRIFRLIRPLKTITMLPNMRRFFTALINSLIDLSAAFLTTLFFILIFSVLGLSLWVDRFNYFCRTTSIPEHGAFPLNPEFRNTLCGGRNDCGGQSQFCLSSSHFYRNKTLFLSDAYEWDKEIKSEAFYYGLINFKNIFFSFLAVFITTTGEGWSRIMYLLMDGHNYFISLLYFVVCVIVNYFFMLNLTVAVLLYNFERSRMVELDIERGIRKRRPGKRKLFTIAYQNKLSQQSNNMKYKKKYPLIMKKENSSVASLEKIISFCEKLKSFRFFISIEPKTSYHKNYKFCYYCFYVYSQPIAQIFFYLCIFGNCILLAFDRADIGKDEYHVMEKLNITLVSIFAFEIVLQIIAISPQKFFRNCLNIWDFLVVLISFIEIIIKEKKESTTNATSIASVFRVMRIVRVFKLFRSLHQFQIVMEGIKQTIKRMVDFLLLFIIILYMYSLLGHSLFNNSLRFSSYTGKYHSASNSNAFNFDDLLNSVISVFIIIIGDHWENLFTECYRSERNIPSVVMIYFLSLVIIGQITLMNIFLAYLIDNFEKACSILEKNTRVKENMLGSVYESTKIYQMLIAESESNSQNVINIFNVYLSKLKKKKLVKGNKMILVAKAKMDFITNQCVINDNINALHQVKKGKNIKEIYFNSYFNNHGQTKEINKSIDEVKSYNFDINYNKPPDFTKINKITNPNQNKAKTIIGTEKEIENKIKEILGEIEESEDESDMIIENYDEEEEDNDETENLCNSTNNNNENISQSVVKVPTETGTRINDKEYHLLSETNKPFHLLQSNKKFKLEKGKTINHMHLVREKLRPTVTTNSIHEKVEEVKTIKKEETMIIIDETPIYEKIINHMKNSSLFIFHRDWKIRKLIRKMVKRQEFNYIIFALIFCNIIVLCFDNPWVKPNSTSDYCLVFFNYFFNIIFIIEGLLKIISDGFLFRAKTQIKLSLSGKGTTIFEEIMNEIKNPNTKQNFDQMSEQDKIQSIQYAIRQIDKQSAYIRNPINCIDFFCIIVGIIDISGGIGNLRYLRTLRAIRSIKPIRLLTKSQDLNLLVKCLIKSIPAMGNVLLICIVYIFIFAMLGISLFKSDMNYYCDINEELSLEDCNLAGGHWVEYYDNFSNFIKGLQTTFILMLTENWENIMSFCANKKGTKLVYVYYILCIIIGNLFVLNLIVSVLIQKFKSIKHTSTDYGQLSLPEKEWVKYQKIMMKYKPVQRYKNNKKSKIKQKIKEVVESPYFEYTISMLILLSTLTLMMQYEGASSIYSNVLEGFNYVFTAFFNIELVFKLIVHGFLFFKNSWNSFDFVVVILCDFVVILNIFSYIGVIDTHSMSTLPIILRLFRVFRIFRIISTFGKLRALIDTLVYMIPSVANVGLIIGILLLIYANIGMNIFGTVPYRDYINRNNNFRNFLSGVVLLFQVSTGENWSKMMHELSYHNCKDPTSSEYSADYYCYKYNIVCYDDEMVNYTTMNELNYYSCGNNFSYFFFISFVIIGPVFLLNLCIVMVVEGFSDSMTENESMMTEEFMTKFVNLWMQYDPQCKKLILPQEFVLIMKELLPPFGFNYDRHILSNPLKAEKERHQFKIFNQYLQSDKNEDSLTEINFNDEVFGQYYNNLPYAYQFTNFYLSKNKKYYTTDLEILRLVDKFNLITFEDKTGIQSEKLSYTFSNYLGNTTVTTTKKEYYVHYVDACIAISRYAVAKTQNIQFEKLRQKLVNSYTFNMWSEKFNKNEIMPIFNTNTYDNFDEHNILVNRLAPKILHRINMLYKKKLKHVQTKLKMRGKKEEKDSMNFIQDNKATTQKIQSLTEQSFHFVNTINTIISNKIRKSLNFPTKKTTKNKRRKRFTENYLTKQELIKMTLVDNDFH